MTKGKILYERDKTPLHWSERTMIDPESPPNSYVLEWVQKAENDFEAAVALLNLQTGTFNDIICYHCQQCAEKYAKAYLVHRAIEFARTHNLLELLELCQKRDVAFATIHIQMDLLNNYGVDIRYPGRFTSLEEAQGAVEAMNTIRTFYRSKLDLT
ncbi:MAG: HEPN domain-containing protein [Anaerolineales bacterium]|nr:HEPN domain-containing protein [Anaerolineales bacterium]